MACALGVFLFIGGNGAASCVVSVEFVVSAAATKPARGEDEPFADGGERIPMPIAGPASPP